MPCAVDAVLGPVRAEVLPGLDALPADAAALFGSDPALGFQSTRAWYERAVADALPDGTVPLFLLCREGERTLAVFPLRRGADGAVGGLTTPYTVLYQPLTAPGLDAAGLRAVGRAFGRACRAWPTLRLDALDADWPGLDPVLAGAHDAGLAARRFDHFGNWYEDVAGRGWDEYLAGRPGGLRETIRRKTRACARDPSVSLEVVRAPDASPDAPSGAIEAAIAAYEEVYARSWKEPEPFPRFGPGLMRAAAAAGALRVGVLRVHGRPVAAQYWTVCGGAATVLKLAHDEAFKPLSPGTVLTAHLIHGLLDEGVHGLDFGRGDDPYKRSWAGRRRQRVGVLLMNPRRPAGLAELGRAAAGDLRRWATRRIAGARGG